MRALQVMVPLLAFGLVGCGGSSLPSPVPVSGTVTLNGKPVDAAVVTFIGAAGARSGSGKTGTDGTFKLTTINTDDGAPPGEYVVTISKVEAKVSGPAVDVTKGQFGPAYEAGMGAAAKGNMASLQKNLLPEKYASAADSGLKRTVVKGEPNNFEIKL